MALGFKVEKDGYIVSSDGNETLELNYLSWYGRPAKYDIRRWDGNEAHKGLTLTEGELYELIEVIAEELGKKVISEELYDAIIDNFTEELSEEEADITDIDDDELDEIKDFKYIEALLNVAPREEPVHVRKCENCMNYRNESCAGFGLCEEYIYSPGISEEELML